MDIQLKAQLSAAIQQVIDDNCEDQLWDHWIHDDLVSQMTDAAALVFDSSQKGQAHMEREG